MALTHLIGSPKCGTTSVAYDIVQNGGLCYSKQGKEPKLWFSLSHNQATTSLVTEYKRLFSGCDTYIDANPTRFSNMHALELMVNLQKASALKFRFLICLREPVHRHLSRYNHRLREPQEGSWNFWDMIKTKYNITNPGVPSYVEFVQYEEMYINYMCKENVTCMLRTNTWMAEGVYAPFLQQWTTQFARQQIFIIQYERLNHSNYLSFLNITKTTPIQNLNHHLVTQKSTMPCSIRDKLEAFYRPWNEMLYTLIEHSKGTAPPMEVFGRFPRPECES